MYCGFDKRVLYSSEAYLKLFNRQQICAELSICTSLVLWPAARLPAKSAGPTDSVSSASDSILTDSGTQTFGYDGTSWSVENDLKYERIPKVLENLHKASASQCKIPLRFLF